MTRVPFDPEQFCAELSELGVTKVDVLLASGRRGKVGTKFELATAWRRAATEAAQISCGSTDVRPANTTSERL